MLSSKQILEIREHLENSRNPVFFFDNDPDGLCSFLLLQRFIGRGRGVIIKSFPGLNASYFHRVEEFQADCIFVLDKPIIDEEFIELADKAGIPLIHIDHHDVARAEKIKNHYNTYHESKLNEPTSYLCYKVAERKEDEWIAAIGCISDGFIPEFMADLKKSYPELIEINYKSAFDIRYCTEFGKIARAISFSLKDKTTNVISMMRFLMKAKNIQDLLEDNKNTKAIWQRYEEINLKYQRLMKKAEEEYNSKDNLLFFSYSGDMSISQYIADELLFKHPRKIIVVAYTKGNIANVSLRWEKDIRVPVVKAIASIEGATGGGHRNSCGARIPADRLVEFLNILKSEIKN